MILIIVTKSINIIIIITPNYFTRITVNPRNLSKLSGNGVVSARWADRDYLCSLAGPTPADPASWPQAGGIWPLRIAFLAKIDLQKLHTIYDHHGSRSRSYPVKRSARLSKKFQSLSRRVSVSKTQNFSLKQDLILKMLKIYYLNRKV